MDEKSTACVPLISPVVVWAVYPSAFKVRGSKYLDCCHATASPGLFCTMSITTGALAGGEAAVGADSSAKSTRACII